MQGDPKIGLSVKGLNQATKPLSDALTKMSKKLDRDWTVRPAADGEASKFIGSEESVVLLLSAGDRGGTLHRFDVFEDGEFKQYDISATLVT